MIFTAQFKDSEKPYLALIGEKEDLEFFIELEHNELKERGWTLVYFSKFPEIANSQVFLFQKNNQTIMTRLKG